MAYQIKSTPFFRRMLTTSKKNGQLQRLKEEYDRIKEFNDRAIEMKMRQVRLKRLFKEIEEIKESSNYMPKRRRMVSKSNSVIRVETLAKAKELGKEYSKINALVGSNNNNKLEHFPIVPSYATQYENKHVDKKYLMAKAMRYGNESSLANLEKIMQCPPRRSAKSVKKSSSTMSENLERLKQRNSYGNSRSNINMSKLFDRKRHMKLTNADAAPAAVKPQTTRIKIVSHNHCPEDDVERFGEMLLPADSDVFQSAGNSSADVKQSFRSFDVKNEDSIMRARAEQHWHKLSLMVRNRFDTCLRRELLPLDQSENAEFSLQNSDNCMDFTQNEMSDINVTPQHSELFDEVVSNEVLLNVEPLTFPDDCITQKSPKLDLGVEPTSDYITEANYDFNSVPIKTRPSEKVQQLAKIFEPFVRQAAEAEAIDGVLQLKSLMEHS